MHGNVASVGMYAVVLTSMAWNHCTAREGQSLG